MVDKQDQMAERPEEAEVKTGDDAERAALTESDDAEGKSGDAGQDEQDAGGWKALALKHKADAEENKRLKARLEELESERAAETGANVPPTAQPNPYQQNDPNANYAERQAVAEQERLAALMREVQQDAALGDTKAQLLLASLHYQHQAQVQTVNELQFAKMSSSEQDLARRYFATGDYRTPEAARKAALGDLSVQERERMARQRKALESEQKARESRDVVETVTRSVSSREVAANGPMKLHQWTTAWNAAEERGDTKRLKELMAMEREGRIVR